MAGALRDALAKTNVKKTRSEASRASPGSLLGPSWVPFGGPWPSLGGLWALPGHVLDLPWAFLGALGRLLAAMDASRVDFGASRDDFWRLWGGSELDLGGFLNKFR